MGDLRTDDKYIYINCEYAEAYIPNSMVGDIDEKASSICYQFGEAFKTMGIFNITFFDSDQSENGRDGIIMYPNLITTEPSSTVVRNKTIDGVTDKYLVLQFYKGDILMETESPKSADNCELFMRLITSGKIPRSLTYDEIFDAWMENFKINSLHPDVPSVVLQVIIGEMCRDKKDPSVQFRKIAGKGNYDPMGYEPMNMNEVSAYSSVGASLSFERFGEKIATSINMTKEGTPQKVSPIEKVLTM